MRWTTDLLLFTWTAGTLDALSYIRSQVFTANMTGNTVLLAVHLIQGEFGSFLHNLTAMLAYAFGCLVAVVIFDETTPLRTTKNLVLAARIEFPLLFAFGWLWLAGRSSHSFGYATIAVAAISLGIQSVAVRRLRVHGVATTFITGTVTESVVATTRAIRIRHWAGAWPPWSPKVATLIAIVFTYLLAAAAAAYLSVHWNIAAAFLSLPTLLPVMFRSGNRSPA